MPDQPDQPDEQRPAWWVPRVLAAVAVTVAIIGGMAWAADRPTSSGSAEGSSESSADGAGPDGGAAYDEPRDVAVTTYAVGGSLLSADRHLVEDATGDPVAVAVAQLVSGQVVDDDLTTAWPVEEVGVATRVGSDRVTVDLAGIETGADVGRDRATTALQALVWTVGTATGSRLPVEVLVDGAPVERLWGVDVTELVQPDEAALAPVQVDSPADGAVVSSAFTVRGWVRAEAGTLSWELRSGEEVVRQGTLPAGSTDGVTAYDVDVSSPVGDFVLVVSLPDGSRDTKQLRVR